MNILKRFNGISVGAALDMTTHLQHGLIFLSQLRFNFILLQSHHDESGAILLVPPRLLSGFRKPPSYTDDCCTCTPLWREQRWLCCIALPPRLYIYRHVWCSQISQIRVELPSISGALYGLVRATSSLCLIEVSEESVIMDNLAGSFIQLAKLFSPT